MTEVEVTLTAEQARALTDDIRARVTDLLPLITRAYEERADRALGYTTWAEYCAAELSGLRVPLGDRPAMVAELRQSGMTQREIGAALGVSNATVSRHLSPSVTDVTDDGLSVEPSPLPDGPRDCKYCYGTHDLEIGPDGSLIVCSNCQAGLATLGDANAAGGYDAWVARIAEVFHERSRPEPGRPIPVAERPQPSPWTAEEERESVERDRRQRHTRYFAEAVVSLWSLLDPDPIAFAEQTWDGHANPHRSTAGAKDAFTDKGLRLLAERLCALADHVNEAGGTL